MRSEPTVVRTGYGSLKCQRNDLTECRSGARRAPAVGPGRATAG